jgi:hypothetical protein
MKVEYISHDQLIEQLAKDITAALQDKGNKVEAFLKTIKKMLKANVKDQDIEAAIEITKKKDLEAVQKLLDESMEVYAKELDADNDVLKMLGNLKI